MPLFTKHGRTMLFIHSPTTGGSSVALFFQRNGFAIDGFRSAWFGVAHRESSLQHRHRETIVAALWRDSVACESRFAFVRDALDRLLPECPHQCRSEDWPGRRLTDRGLATRVARVFEMNEENPVPFDDHIRPHGAFPLDDIVVFRFENGFRNLARFLHVGEPRYRFGFDFTAFPHWPKVPTGSPWRSPGRRGTGYSGSTNRMTRGPARAAAPRRLPLTTHIVYDLRRGSFAPKRRASAPVARPGTKREARS